MDRRRRDAGGHLWLAQRPCDRKQADEGERGSRGQGARREAPAGGIPQGVHLPRVDRSLVRTRRPGRAGKPVLIAAGDLAEPFERAPAIDPPLPAGGAQRNAIPGYDFPDLLVMHHYVREAPVAGSSLRSLGAFGNVYGIESFMDELALAANAERVEFRLRHLKEPRGRAVIDAAVRKSQWAK